MQILQHINTIGWVVYFESCRIQNILVKTPYEWGRNILALCMGD
jgi:hypothetical protein